MWRATKLPAIVVVAPRATKTVRKPPTNKTDAKINFNRDETVLIFSEPAMVS